MEQMAYPKLLDKVRGALYGHAIGDSMGATTEFMAVGDIKAKYGVVDGLIGGGWLDLQPGDVTDDTEMSICVMQALEDEARHNDRFKRPWRFKRTVAEKFILWLDRGPKDVGGACRRGIMVAKSGEYVPYDPTALGNGALMRALPCALVGLDTFNVAQATITHNNEIQSEAVLTYSKMVRGLITGKFSVIKPTALQNPSGHVENSFNNARYWTRQRTFKDAIVGAVNDGGDADTIAAITGSLAGARFGFQAIPVGWVDTLNPQVRTELDIFAEFVVQCAQEFKTVVY